MNITFPRADFGLTLMYNDHACYFETVAERVADQGYGVKPEDWVSFEEMHKAIALNQVWTLQWYPDNANSFHQFSASTLEALMKHVNAHYPS